MGGQACSSQVQMAGALTIGQCLLKLVVGYHTAPVLINPTKLRLVKLAIQSAGKAIQGQNQGLPLLSILN